MNYIFDIDGTLMNIDHRRHFVEGETKDWKSFEENIKYDSVNTKLNNLISQLSDIHWEKHHVEYGECDKYDVGHPRNDIYYFSGRSEKHRDITVAQILYGMFKEKYSIEYLLKEFKNKNSLWCEHTYPAISSKLFLRADKDYRADAIIKSEILDKLIRVGLIDENNLIIFDDRQSVVDMWRARGLTCFQVAKGDF